MMYLKYVGSHGTFDVEALPKVILGLVVVLSVLELTESIAGFVPVFSRSLVGLLIIVLILLWYVDRR